MRVFLYQFSIGFHFEHYKYSVWKKKILLNFSKVVIKMCSVIFLALLLTEDKVSKNCSIHIFRNRCKFSRILYLFCPEQMKTYIDWMSIIGNRPFVSSRVYVHRGGGHWNEYMPLFDSCILYLCWNNHTSSGLWTVYTDKSGVDKNVIQLLADSLPYWSKTHDWESNRFYTRCRPSRLPTTSEANASSHKYYCRKLIRMLRLPPPAGTICGHQIIW